jgi:nucleotide-binding universal stress UspA family protein
MSYQHILVAFDGSTESEVALRVALCIARTSKGRLDILGVEEPAPLVAPTEGSPDGELRAGVAAAVEIARGAGVEAAGHVRAGYPAEVIVRFGVENGCDLVVVGASGAFGRLGHTADKVVDQAASAVLVAREAPAPGS